MSTDYYLKQNVVLEPLVNRWYAWSVLMAPSTAPLYVAHHVRILQSFVSAPQVHAAAVKNPALLGGPFISYGVDRLDAVKALLERTLKEQASALAFAEAIQGLRTLLSTEAAGFSLEPLYAKVPDLLRGYVELGYDLSNRPTFRLLEGLLYKSPHRRESAQGLALWPIDTDDRPFVFSTPRLEEPGRVELPVAFRHEGIDELMRLRHTPAPLDKLREIVKALGAQTTSDADLQPLVTTAPPKIAPTYAEGGVRVRYFGHACVLLQTPGVSILTDPVISYPYENALPRYTLEDLPSKIDYVLLTHAHADHFMLETLLPLRRRIGTVLVPKSSGDLQDPSLKMILKNLGFPDVRELEDLESLEVEGGTITGVPFLGEHGDLLIRSKIAFHVQLLGRSIVIAADSNAIEPRLYDHLADLFPPVDAFFLGMECEGAPMSWIYSPMLTTPLARKMDQTRRLDGSNAARASTIVRKLKAKRVYVYAMGQEPWLNHVMALKYTETSPQIVESDRLIAELRADGVVAERPFCKMELVL